MLIGLEILPAHRTEALLEEVRRIFEYQDVPITQEILDWHFIKIAKKDFEELDENSQQLVLAILSLFECSMCIDTFYIYTHCGPHVYFEDGVLKFPKIVARSDYG